MAFECGCLEGYENSPVPRVRQDDEEERVHVVRQDAYETFGIPNRYGTGINWNEFHTNTRYPNATE